MGQVILGILAIIAIAVVIEYKEIFLALIVLGVAAYFIIKYIRKKKAASANHSEPTTTPTVIEPLPYTPSKIIDNPPSVSQALPKPEPEPETKPENPRLEQFKRELNAIPRVDITLSDPAPRQLLRDIPSYSFSNVTRTTRFDTMFPLVFLDTETTGLSPSNDDIVEISAIKFDYGMVPVSCLTTLCKPHRPIPEKASSINHITDEMVADAPDFRQVAPALTEFIRGCSLAGHNLDFDLRFIFAHGVKLPEGTRYYDTLDISHRTIRKSDVYNYKLGTLCIYYGIWRDDAHRSLSDCYATAKVFSKLVYDKTYRRLESEEELVPNLGTEIFSEL